MTDESAEDKASGAASGQNEPVVMWLDDGAAAKYGDVIRWNWWGSEDCTLWSFTGLYTRRGVVYLGGGIDFGMGMGNVYSVAEVIEASENNDPDDRGVKRVGSAPKLAEYIRNFIDT